MDHGSWVMGHTRSYAEREACRVCRESPLKGGQDGAAGCPKRGTSGAPRGARRTLEKAPGLQM